MHSGIGLIDFQAFCWQDRDRENTIFVCHPEHKIKDYDFGKRNHMRLSYTILCHRIASLPRTDTLRQALYTTSRTEGHTLELLASAAAAASPTRPRRLGANRSEEESQGSVKQEADSSRTEITTSTFNTIDQRIDGIPPEAILNDEIQMKDIKENLEKLQIGSQMLSIRDDLNKNDIFSKESSEAMYRMGNVELIELRQTTSTVQCPACWKHIQERMLQCLCGNWLRPDEHTVNQIKLRFAELVKPYY